LHWRHCSCYFDWHSCLCSGWNSSVIYCSNFYSHCRLQCVVSSASVLCCLPLAFASNSAPELVCTCVLSLPKFQVNTTNDTTFTCLNSSISFLQYQGVFNGKLHVDVLLRAKLFVVHAVHTSQCLQGVRVIPVHEFCQSQRICNKNATILTQIQRIQIRVTWAGLDYRVLIRHEQLSLV